ncbi:unnamed protein product [Prorocentrum cordatum]|uniref:Uncharacterized protein n=1 Tax=Prorocentrum cordatum TaxID=2364126 RepID=A0ABN9U737_9DINO|nr:unnamed protein product [Polarella glacialis]
MAVMLYCTPPGLQTPSSCGTFRAGLHCIARPASRLRALGCLGARGAAMSVRLPYGRLAAGPPDGQAAPAWRLARLRLAAGSLAACTGAGALAVAGWHAGARLPAAPEARAPNPGGPPSGQGAGGGEEALVEGAGACGSTCVGHTCDYWLETNPFASCEVLEGRGCDCSGCRGCAGGGGGARGGSAPARGILEGRAAAPIISEPVVGPRRVRHV